MEELKAKKPCFYQNSDKAILMYEYSSKTSYSVCCIYVKGKIKGVIHIFLVDSDFLTESFRFSLPRVAGLHN